MSRTPRVPHSYYNITDCLLYCSFSTDSMSANLSLKYRFIQIFLPLKLGPQVQEVDVPMNYIILQEPGRLSCAHKAQTSQEPGGVGGELRPGRSGWAFIHVSRTFLRLSEKEKPLQLSGSVRCNLYILYYIWICIHIRNTVLIQ